MSDISQDFEELPVERNEMPENIEDYVKDAHIIVLAYNYLKENYEFRNNVVALEYEFRKKGEENFRFLDDPAYRDLDQELRLKVGKIDERYMKNWIFGNRLAFKFDPIKEYLFSLKKWDGNTDWIRLYLQQIYLENEEHREIFLWAFRKWFVAMVGSLVQNEIVNQTCFILLSKQGRYKTTFLNSLVPKDYRLDYLYSSTFIAHNKDHEKYLFTKWLINLDEMQAFNRSDIESIKSKITQDRIAIRLPYAKADTKAWRKASFCGSVNKDKFLNDATGSRRFLPFKIEDIKIDPDFKIDNIYSQALELFKQGFKFYFDREDIEKIEHHNDAYKDKQFEEEHLLLHFVAPSQAQIDNKDRNIQYLTATQIMEWLYKKYENYNKNNTVRRNIGATLQANGFITIKKRINGKVMQVYPVKIIDNPIMTNEDGTEMVESMPDHFPI